mmetsp:Transcript_20300/g.42523  ORF Transcript_20300/g.42523 Transcript_20300/m.42523 type:complete len:155 (-) Transcript_20300:109-573(-)
METPNGRFKQGRRICLSMSDFHPETWNPMWSVGTILTGLFSFMLDTSPTLGSMVTTDKEKNELAGKSLKWNVEKKKFRMLFPKYVDKYRSLNNLPPGTPLPSSSSSIAGVMGSSAQLEELNRFIRRYKDVITATGLTAFLVLMSFITFQHTTRG